MSFKDRLGDFEYREEVVDIREIFPKFNTANIDKLKSPFQLDTPISDPHRYILNLSVYLWNGYGDILKTLGFYDPESRKFSGHCHQITPALGTMLRLFGFEEVAYLEGFRVDPETGLMVPPQEEESQMREEFCSIGRIPYCCLEVRVGGENFYLSGKHIKQSNGSPKALLTPDCYREAIEGFAHQLDPRKSVIYLDQVTDKPWINDSKPFVWKKQKLGEEGSPTESVEYFRTFARMTLNI